jgi:hypothetical protein
MRTSQPKLVRYRRKASQFVTAVRLNLDTKGLRYRKWGGEQVGKRGDWLVDNQGDVYTVDATSFRRTYKQRSPGVFVKVAPVWARLAQENGTILTKEGTTRYRRGDFLVFNKANAKDGYATSRAKFRAMYVRDRKR